MDWQKLIIDIEGTGLSLTEIGKTVGAPVSTLSDLKQRRSREPKGSLALALSMLHKRRLSARRRSSAQQPQSAEPTNV